MNYSEFGRYADPQHDRRSSKKGAGDPRLSPPEKQSGRTVPVKTWMVISQRSMTGKNLMATTPTELLFMSKNAKCCESRSSL